MKNKILIIMALMIGFTFSQKVTTRTPASSDFVKLLDSNTEEWDQTLTQIFGAGLDATFGDVTVDDVTFDQIVADSIDVDFIGIVDTYATGSNSIKITDTFTQNAAAAHKSINVGLTYAPTLGTACPIGVVGKVTLDGNLTAQSGTSYPGLGWGVQGQIHVADTSTINGSTYGAPGAVYAGLRGVITGAGTVTFTKGALTGLYSEIQLAQENANDGANFNIYGAWIRNQGVATTTDVAAGLFIDANTSFPNTFLKGIDVNDAVMGIEIDATTTGIDFASAMTQEIIGQNDETIDNATDGSWDFGAADLVATGGDITGANGNAIDIGEAVDGTITISRDDAGAMILTTADNDANADLTIVPGGTGNLLLGDSGGTAQIASSDWAISTAGDMTNIGTIGLDGTITQARTTTANSYTNDISTEWTAGGNMASGGSNGIYAIVNPVDTLQNAYGLRARMDLRDATEDVYVNQLHAVDALINLNDTGLVDFFADDNISVVGAAIHGGVATALMDGTGTGALGGATLNLYQGMWGPTAEQDYALETNFAKFISHAGTTVDYGLNIESSSDMDAGILLNNHASNSPATMDVGIEMISASGKMIYGIDMDAADMTTADLRLNKGALINNSHADSLLITEAVTVIDGELIVTGNSTKYAGMYMYESTGTQVVRAASEYYAVDGEFGAGDLNGFTFVAGSEGEIADIASIAAGDSTAYSDATHGLTTGDYITVSSVNHAGTVQVVVIDADSFHTSIDFVGDETGTWNEGDYLLAGTGTAGKYLLNLAMTISAGAAAKEFKFEPVVNTTDKDECAFQFTTQGSAHNAGAGAGIITIAEGDRIWVKFEGLTDGTNIAYEHGNLVLTKL